MSVCLKRRGEQDTQNLEKDTREMFLNFGAIISSAVCTEDC